MMEALDEVAAGVLYTEFRSYYHNEAPTAMDDSYSLSEDPAFGFHSVRAADGLLSNDLDTEGDQLSAVLIDDAAHGSVVIRQDGSFVYSPEPDFFGTDSFTYQAFDGQGSNVATVTLQVANAYDAPVPVADDYRMLPTETLAVTVEQGVLANDANPDDSSLTVAIADGVGFGEVSLQGDGSFAFDPQGFAGETGFTYRVNDGTQWSDPVPVTITVNTPPQAQADQYDVMEDVPLAVSLIDGVLANDLDADDNVLVAVLTAEPLHGNLQFQEDGSFLYSPPAEFSGPDEFRYFVSDGMSPSVDVTVSLRVLPVNDPPEAMDDYYLTLPSNRLEIAAAHGVLANDSDKETTQLQAVLVDPPSHGTLELHLDGGFWYVPTAGFDGTDSFRYQANDLQTRSEPATVHLRVDAQPVQISEFMAANVDTLLTRTRESADDSFRRGTEEAYDWVELWNPTDVPLAIGGLYLTDDSQEITKWQIPAGTTIAPHDYWIVFASGEDLTDPALDERGYLHTNFKLGSDGEYLAVGGPGDVVLFEFGVAYPKQRPDISYGLDSSGRQRYFPEPTPAAENGVGLAGAVADTKFSVDRGFYDQSQQVAISTATPEARVYYTTDGSEPDPQNASARLYQEPLVVGTTTTLRAAAFRDDLLPSNVDTQTYIFVADVPSQRNPPEGYPERWRASSGTLPADYEMDPEITGNPAYQDVMDEALLSIPTISIVTSISNLFDPDSGIYMYPRNEGVAWERPTSVELIFPDGTKGFQVDAGLRIQGGASRLPEKSPKHSFRLLFRDSYGASKLEYPLFGTEAVDEFDTLILRAGFNQSMIHHNTFLGDNRGRAQYVRDQWAKDTQAAMGHPAAHNDYAHLYINGMYWGLYNPTERPANGFAESYLGGDKEDYDVLNSGELIDGDNEAWSELIRRSRANLSDPANYEAVAEMLDIDAFIDYMLINHYGGNMDWDSHNWYALRHRVDGGKFLFFMWDSEFVFIGNADNRLRARDAAPGQLFDRLTDNEEFRIKLADAIQKHMFHDGLLTPDKVVERWNARSDQITDAIVAESARWGDYRRDVDRRGGPFDLIERDVQWVAERERLLNDYFPQRTETVIDQYRARNLFPTIAAPEFSQRGGTILSGQQVTLQAEDGAVVYYTLDGRDPRDAAGEVAAGAAVHDCVDTRGSRNGFGTGPGRGHGVVSDRSRPLHAQRDGRFSRKSAYLGDSLQSRIADGG